MNRRGEAGSAVVDFVFVLLLLVPLFGGVMQVALVLHVRNTTAAAAAEGARYAAVQGSSKELGEAKIKEDIADTLGTKMTTDVDVDRTDVGGVPGFEAVVITEVPVLGLGGPAMTIRVTGHAVQEAPGGTP